MRSNPLDTSSLCAKEKQLSRSFIHLLVALCQKMTIQDVAEMLNVSWDLVKDHHKDYLHKIYRKRDWKRLKYLGIDEFSVKKGHKYLTIAVDLEIGDIIFANEGKSKETLILLLDERQLEFPPAVN